MNGLELLALVYAGGVSERWDDPTVNDWADVLATFPLFLEVGRRRLRKLARHATSAEFAPGETIIFAGDRDNVLYLILGGEVKTVSTAARSRLAGGDYFGELALIDGGPRSATVVAISSVHVLKIPARSVLWLARRNPAVTLRMLRGLTTRLRHLETLAAHPAPIDSKRDVALC